MNTMDTLKKVKILITGKNGQVGHSLVKQLTSKADILALGHDELDITNRQVVLSTVAKFQPDYIINAAAYTAVDKAEQEPELAHQINSNGPQYLAEAANIANAVLLHISTDYVFDGEGALPYSETMETAPQSVYGTTKRTGELAVLSNCNKHIILRTAWVFGEHGNNFVKTMLRLGAEHNSLRIVGDQYGGPTYAGDIAKALITIIEYCNKGTQPEWGIYHFSGTPHVSWAEFADAIFSAATTHKALPHKPTINSIPTTEYPTPAKRPANSKLDCAKIAKQFNIQPSNWQAALQQINLYR